jgi:hypothetical protein
MTTKRKSAGHTVRGAYSPDFKESKITGLERDAYMSGLKGKKPEVNTQKASKSFASRVEANMGLSAKLK